MKVGRAGGVKAGSKALAPHILMGTPGKREDPSLSFHFPGVGAPWALPNFPETSHASKGDKATFHWERLWTPHGATCVSFTALGIGETSAGQAGQHSAGSGVGGQFISFGRGLRRRRRQHRTRSQTLVERTDERETPTWEGRDGVHVGRWQHLRCQFCTRCIN